MKPIKYILIAVLLISNAMGQQEESLKYKEYLESAKKATNRDDEVKFLKMALEERKNNPDNIKLEYQIANLLHTDTTGNQPVKPLEALKYYEQILHKYKYDDYYSSHPAQSENWMESKQNIFVQSAIQAGCVYIYVLKNEAKGREYEHMALDLLNNTYKRRLTDWANEPKPSLPKESPISLGKAWRERRKRAYEERLANWEITQKKALSGDVFEDFELTNTKIAVKHFGLSYGPQSPDMVPVAMGQILKEFPGTPMAKIAQEHIRKASNMSLEKLNKKMNIKNIELNKHIELISTSSDYHRSNIKVKSSNKNEEMADISEHNKSNNKIHIAISILIAIFTFAMGYRIYMDRVKK